VVEDSTAGFLQQKASLSVQPVVEVKHSRFYCYGSKSGDSDKSICSSVKDKQIPRHKDGTKPDTWVAKKRRERRFKGASDPSYNKA
jgi:hypothetical protein